LIFDKLAQEGVTILDQADGIDVEHRPGIDPEELERVIGEYDGLIIRSGTKVTAKILEAAGGLKVVGRAGIGVDNVDVDAASKRGVVVMNTPGGNNVTTAEHTITLMLSLARHIPQANASLRAGEWRRSDFVGTEVCRKTLGIVGIGNIGSIVADRARGLKMKVVAYDPFITEDAAAKLGIELAPLDDVLARADFLSVHTPLTDDTRGLIGEQALAKTKAGVRIINCARGGIIDEAALARAIESGKVAGAALDVYESEPPGSDHPLVSSDKVVATPHLGASTGEAQLNVAIAVAEQVRDFLLHGVVTNAVNVPSVAPEQAAVLMPYVTLAEKIGSLHAQLAGCVPSEVRIEYGGEAAEIDCRPVNAAVLKGMLSSVMETPVNFVNAPFLAEDRGVKVVDVRSRQAAGFSNSIKVEFRGSRGCKLVEGAVFGRDIIRFVRFDDFHFEAIPEGHIVVVRNHDVRGVVGRVGTFLAEENVNIAGLELGRIDGEALQFVHIDSPLDAGQLERLRELGDVTGADTVYLG